MSGPRAGRGAFPQGYIQTGATPPEGEGGGSLPSFPSPLARFGSAGRRTKSRTTTAQNGRAGVGVRADRRWRSLQELVVESLVVSLTLVMLDVLVDDEAQMPLAERDDTMEALFFDRPDEPLGIGIEIRTLRRQPDWPNIATCQDLAKDPRVEGIAVMNQLTRGSQEAVDRIGQIAGHLHGVAVTGPVFGPDPAPLTACNSKAYCVPLVRPFTVVPYSSPPSLPGSVLSGTSIQLALDDTVEPADCRYRYFVMTPPPLDGGCQLRSTLPLVLPTAERLVGAPGTLLGAGTVILRLILDPLMFTGWVSASSPLLLVLNPTLTTVAVGSMLNPEYMPTSVCSCVEKDTVCDPICSVQFRVFLYHAELVAVLGVNSGGTAFVARSFI